MREEIIVSGRMNPKIDPHLHIWHWQIPLYLFLGGLAAGLLFFVALLTIQGKEDKYPTATRWVVSSLWQPSLERPTLLHIFLEKTGF